MGAYGSAENYEFVDMFMLPLVGEIVIIIIIIIISIIIFISYKMKKGIP